MSVNDKHVLLYILLLHRTTYYWSIMLHVLLHHIIRHLPLHATSLRISYAGTDSVSGDVYRRAFLLLWLSAAHVSPEKRWARLGSLLGSRPGSGLTDLLVSPLVTFPISSLYYASHFKCRH